MKSHSQLNCTARRLTMRPAELSVYMMHVLDTCTVLSPEVGVAKKFVHTTCAIFH